MIPYNIELQIEGDTDSYVNYFLCNYDIPSNTKGSVLAELDRRAEKYNYRFIAHGKRSLLNNNNKKGD
jgi:hypothetical protein